jgi:hypothetical protein
MIKPSDRWIAVKSQNVSSLSPRPADVRRGARVLDQHLGVVASRTGRASGASTHNRVVQTGAVNPADVAYSDVCIPTAVTLFLWE